jgi:hypothetical protein
MTPQEILTQLETTLATTPGMVTCKIGLEQNITPDQYPLIRIVPTRMRPQDDVGDKVLLEVTVYFGAALLEVDAGGLEAVYAGLLALEMTIREAVLFGAVRAAWAAGNRMQVKFVDVLFDEDRLPHYKMMASRFEVEG